MLEFYRIPGISRNSREFLFREFRIREFRILENYYTSNRLTLGLSTKTGNRNHTGFRFFYGRHKVAGSLEKWGDSLRVDGKFPRIEKPASEFE